MLPVPQQLPDAYAFYDYITFAVCPVVIKSKRQSGKKSVICNFASLFRSPEMVRGVLNGA